MSADGLRDHKGLSHFVSQLPTHALVPDGTLHLLAGDESGGSPRLASYEESSATFISSCEWITWYAPWRNTVECFIKHFHK